ncbi:hypothetical protein HOO68_02040 [Candidatus Gracilibacteria bacterium]|nr:hypothetical protein [Candidatus Gracilibacteria bacterium]
MNKVSIIAIGFILLSPSILFASENDWSWGASQQGTIHQDDSRMVGMTTGSGGSGSTMLHGTNGTHIKDAILTARPSKPPMGTGAMVGSGMINSERPLPPKPPMGTGAEIMDPEMRAITMAIVKLAPENRNELMKIIRTYLEEKGIQENGLKKGWDGSIKGNKTPIEIKDKHEIQKEKIKTLREKQKEMRAKLSSENKKNYVGHVTLMK